MSYFSFALFPICYILSLSLSLTSFCILGAYLLSLPFYSVSTVYLFALVHVDFSHSAHHIMTSTPTLSHILRYVPRMVGRGWSIVLFLLVDLVTQCLLAFSFFEDIEVWLIVVPCFEDLDPLPY